MKIKLQLLTFLICCFTVLSAQGFNSDDSLASAENENIEIIKTSPPNTFGKPIIRKISADSIKALKAQKDFAYMQYIDSFFRNQKNHVRPIDTSVQEDGKTGFFSNPALRKLYWLLAFGAVIWVVWHLFIGKGSLFTSNKKMQQISDEEITESGTITSLEKLTANAINARDYRLATRYLYLRTLSLLGERELIAISPKKTNNQYINELHGKSQLPAFSMLTLQYEYAWYGNFLLNAEQFEPINKGFQHFFKELS